MTTQSPPALPELAAAGSLPRALDLASPSTIRRVRLMLEVTLLFVLMPFAMAFAVHTYRVPLLLLLQPVLIAFVLYLLWDPTFSLRRELTRGFSWRTLAAILTLVPLVGAAMVAGVWMTYPGDLLSFPTYSPRLWLMVMIFYPLLSALPQEFVYRTFFFHRYSPLFRDRRWLAITVNGALFGFAHVIFGSLVSVVLSAALGLLLAWRYDRTRSVWAVWLEHSLYGQLAFTIGLGRYFFTGVSLN